MPSRDYNAHSEGTTATHRPIGQLCCVNEECALRGQYARGNLSVRNGKSSGRWRILRCVACGSEFSERKGTALWGSRMPLEKAEAIAQHLQEGCGIRQTARLVGASKDGVTAIAKRLGLHAKRFHDQHVQDLIVTEAQCDEKWSFVEKTIWTATWRHRSISLPRCQIRARARAGAPRARALAPAPAC